MDHAKKKYRKTKMRQRERDDTPLCANHWKITIEKYRGKVQRMKWKEVGEWVGLGFEEFFLDI